MMPRAPGGGRRQALALAVGAALASALACDNEVAVPENATFTGRFALVSVDGQPLPVPYTDDLGVGYTLLGDTLRFRDDDTFDEALVLVQGEDTVRAGKRSPFRPVTSDSIAITEWAGGVGVGRLEGSTLTILANDGPREWRYTAF
jgi:hypothetical protein